MKNFKADKITRKHITVLLLAFVMMSVFLLPGCSNENKNEIITSIDQLAEPGRRIGVAADTSEGQLVEAQFPNADVKYYKDDMSAYVSVAQGKIDAFIFNKVSMESALRNGLSGVHLLDENFGEGNKGAVAFSPVTKIPDLENKVNTFIRELKSNGTLDDMKERWLIEQNEEMPDIDVPLVSDTHLVVGTTGTNMPFTYYIGTEIGGYDIELANRFAAWLGATIEYKIYDYDGIVAAAQSGDIDCIFANLFITPERLEAIKFSEPTFEGEIGVMVSNEGIASTDEKESSSVTIPKASDYAEKRIAVMTGTNFPEIVTKVYPKAEQYYFNTVADMISALGSGKVDAIAMDEPVARSVAAETGLNRHRRRISGKF